MDQRSNDEWLMALRAEGLTRDHAIADLRALLIRSLRFGLASQGNVREADLDDFAQEALLRILTHLATFRGESQFTTWAAKIAIRVAFSALRRQRWRDVSLQEVIEAYGKGIVPVDLANPSSDPERQVLQQLALAKLRQVIADDLTDKQRVALVAVRLAGMPVEEVARLVGTNRNALYKLLHDAKLRLKKRLEQEGMPADEMLALFA